MHTTTLDTNKSAVRNRSPLSILTITINTRLTQTNKDRKKERQRKERKKNPETKNEEEESRTKRYTTPHMKIKRARGTETTARHNV